MTNLTRLGQRGINGVAFELTPIARELKAYGEIETAEWLLHVDDETHDSVSRLAMEKLLSEDVIIDKALCVSAVEVFQGSPRPLRRKRRYYKDVDQGFARNGT